MDVYEISVDLRAGVRDLDFVRALEGYLGALQDRQSELLKSISDYTRAGNDAMTASAASLIESTNRMRMTMLVVVLGISLVTASLAAGFWDWIRRGTPATWERAEGRS